VLSDNWYVLEESHFQYPQAQTEAEIRAGIRRLADIL